MGVGFNLQSGNFITPWERSAVGQVWACLGLCFRGAASLGATEVAPHALIR
jgi:hypothetical protein